MINMPVNPDVGFTLITLIVVCISFVLFFLRKEKVIELKGQYFKISLLFLIGFILVHFQFYLDFILGNHIYFTYNYFVNGEIVSLSMLASSIAILSFIIGYFICANCMKGGGLKKNLLRGYNRIRMYSCRKLIYSSWFSFLLFIIFVDRSYFSGKYSVINLGNIANYLQFFLIDFICAYYIVNSYNLAIHNKDISVKLYLKYLDKSMILLTFIYLLLVMLSGDRGPIFQITLTIIGGYFFAIRRKLRLRYCVVFVVVSAFIFANLGFIREMRDYSSFSGRIEQANRTRSLLPHYKSISPYTFELATSVRTLHAAVEYTENNDFFYGQNQFYELLGILPGFGLLSREFIGIEKQDLSSAVFLTEYLFDKHSEALGPPHGLGTSCVADVYLDFGVLGVLMFFLIFGIFIRYLEHNSFANSLPKLFVWIMAFVFLSKAIYIGRSTIISTFKECLQIYIFVYLFVLLDTKK
jgi:oligosaccharide repeat unit polymerase